MALIYIVEDDESIREIETIALKNSNYIVSAFENAKEFYKKLDELVPDLILLDVMLPDESGYDIVRKLRKRPATWFCQPFTPTTSPTPSIRSSNTPPLRA